MREKSTLEGEVGKLKEENEDLEKKLTEFMREKSALEGEVGKLKEENEDLVADVETLKKWSDDLHQVVKIVQRDFENLFEDIKNEKNLFEPGTSHTDNCDVSVLPTRYMHIMSFPRLYYAFFEKEKRWGPKKKQK